MGYMNRHHTPMTPEQRAMAESHIPLALAIARDHFPRVPWRARRDLRQAALYALCYAAARFDPSMGFEFSTYAHHCVWGKLCLFVKDMTKNAGRTVSLDREYDDANLHDILGEEDESGDELGRRESATLAHGLLACLDPRKREVIERRYGMNGRKTQTLQEIGKAFGVTRERIRQLEIQALEKLRDAALQISLDKARSCG